MLQGLMQATPLQIGTILRYAAAAHGGREIVSRQTDGPLFRYNYAGLLERVEKAAKATAALGVRVGDRVSSLAWNTHRHLELFYGVTGLGAVLHTANPRLHDEQLVFTINHAESTVLFYEPNLEAQVARIAPKLETVQRFVVLSADPRAAAGPLNALPYEALLEAEDAGFDWPSFDENAGAFLCYTSGTTGDPKGVLYSHRAVVLHAMAAGLPSAFGLTAFDGVMPCSSLYHATAWGLPFVGPLAGCKLILPADRMDPPSLHELIVGEGVTFTGGVPTIWTLYLDYLDRTGQAPGPLQRVVIAGSAVPRAMAETFTRRYGVTVLQLWGMTETCPLGVVATPTPALAALGEEALNETIWTRQGRLQFGIELRTVDDQGQPLPWDNVSSGALQVRGPWTVQRYFKAASEAADADGWFDTGDMATLDALGYMRITDRTKDAIKSGGEWISSIDLENAAAGCPGVKIAAVIGVPHPKWEERPMLIVEAHDDAVVEAEAVRAHLKPLVAKWWMPDQIVFAPVPLTATGKIDKKLLRERHRPRAW